MDDYLIFWIIAAAAFAVLEAVTVAFVALYFAVGSVAAALVAWADGGLTWQLLAFTLTGVVLMVLTRPVLKSRLESVNVPTNVDRMVGKSGIVTIAIDNDANTGQIRVGTEYWTARLSEAVTDTSVPVDGRVQIVAIEGVTARVIPKVTTPV
ncbi:MAG: Membrane protein implicated in regulation of rane protease [Thermoleophilia bacterium]|nr:Membrane protein implicated in regulation of rane protease [Thermoleophilia bacterium]